MPLTIIKLEQMLLERFPARDAETWDRTGLTVGNPASGLTKVAIALDPSIAAIEEAARVGANVLLTHHPLYLDAPDDFQPAQSVSVHNGAAVYAAVEHKVAVMSFHTALDVSQEAQQMLPGLLGFEFDHIAEPLNHDASKGYGQFCALDKSNGTLSLEQLAYRCMECFDSVPRVWGDLSRSVSAVVTCTGSAATTGAAALAQGADCLICGEVKYHQALDLSAAGLAIIELGHDISEYPFTSILAQAVLDCGLGKEAIHVIPRPRNWISPSRA